MMAGRVSAAGAAARADLAGFPSGAAVDGAARRHPQHAGRADLQRRRAPRCRRSAAISRFEHVTFRYRIDGPEILHDVSFTVPAGQIVGIVGPSGSGKSTLAKLIQRLYVPESGRVLVDGVDLAMVDIAWLRRQIGVVLQENVLFNRSIRDNIALADPGMPMNRVIAAAEARRRARFHPGAARRLRHDRRRARQHACRAASASASPSPARWSPIRAS